MSMATAPRGPKGHPLLGNLAELRDNWLDTLTRYAREYGDVVPVRFGPRRGVLLSNPDDVERVLMAGNRNFVKSPILRKGRRLLGNGLVTAEGDAWLRERRLVQPAFHRQRLAAYGAVMVENTLEMLEGWEHGQQRDAHADMMALTLRVVADTLFGADVSRDVAGVAEAMKIAVERFNARMESLLFLFPDTVPLPGNWPFLRAAQRLDRIVYGIIEQRRQSHEDRGDLLSLLLRARDEDGSRMTDRQLRDEVMTLFLAGHETTAIALSWTWYLLGLHPEVERKLHDELATVLGDRSPTHEDLPRLEYTNRIISESLRLYPPAWAQARQALGDFEVSGGRQPSGIITLMSQWVVHRDPRWFDQPELFDPDRWQESRVKRLPRFAYFPFGGGQRVCIGAGFATMEAALILATVAQRYRLRLVPDHPVVPWPSITLRPKHGIQVVLEQR